MHFGWFRSTLLGLLKFLQIREGEPNFWGEANLRKVWIIWSLLLYFNFKSFTDLHSLSFITSMHSAWFRSTFHRVLKYLQIKEGGLNLWGEATLQKVWIILSPLLYFNFKSFTDENSLSFIRSMHSAWSKSTFLRVLKFLEIKVWGT